MKKNIYQFFRNKNHQRVISILLVLVLTIGILPMNESVRNGSDRNHTGMTVSAADVYHTGPDPNPKFQYNSNDSAHNITINLDDLVSYSEAYQSYPVYHQNDSIHISTTNSTVLYLEGFKSLGNETYPFSGSIGFVNNDLDTLAMDVPLFDVVKDTVSVNGSQTMGITRIYKSSSRTESKYTPLIANKVVSDTSSNPKAVWNIKAMAYTKDSDLRRLDQFAGFIGTMDNSSSLTLNASLDFTNSANQSIMMDSNHNDIGAACGTMKDSSQLTFSLSIMNGAAEGAVSRVFTGGGNAGGFVGQMSSGSAFTLTALTGTLFGTATQIYTTAADETSGYAGGIVGNNTEGIVTMPNTVYTVNQIISGIKGAGGVYGYYQIPSAVTTFTAGNYLIDNCQINGSGAGGGLFGILENDHDVTITCSSDITTTHQTGSLTCYGGLIGTYHADTTGRSLTINDAITAMTRNAGASHYGGAIGMVDGACYVKFGNLTIKSATGADTSNFGGAVASATKGFIDVNGISFTASTNYSGGGVVGKLGDGVLRMTGTIQLANAKPTSGGQIVNTCDNAIVYADGWTFTRSTNEYDNIGSWGDVIVFGGNLTKSDVLTESGHEITILTPALNAVNSEEQFARTALGLQIDYTKNSFVTGTAVNTNAAITFSGSIDLTGTGLKGLTRDSAAEDNLNAGHCIYQGTITGGGASVTLDIQNVGGKPMYRHLYNGLIGISDGATVNQLTLTGNVSVKAHTTMYVGALSARAKGNFTASGITCSTSFTADGGNIVNLGRLLGEASESIGSITINGTNSFSGNVSSSNSNVKTCLGGVIGRISHKVNAAKNWSISGVTLSGEIKNTSSKATQRIGGLIAEIDHYTNSTVSTPGSYQSRLLTLQNITINGLRVNAALGGEGNVYSSGGLLGYSWLSTDVNIGEITNNTGVNGVSVTNGTVECKSGKASCGDTAGLVYQATGKWTVNHVDMQNITLTGSQSGIRSFGVLVDKGWFSKDSYYSDDSRQALYLLLPQYHVYQIGTNNFSTANITDFDELLTYSAYYSQEAESTARTYSDRGSDDGAVSDIMVNGQAIVSYHNGQTAGGLKMETTAENSKTYVAKTERGRIVNPYSRYYYNLDTIVDGTGDPDKLLKWGAHVYACVNLKKHFSDPFGGSISTNGAYTGGTIPAGTYNMKGYSWYPVNIDASLTVNGTFQFYNHEFEECEKIKNNNNSTKPQMLSLPEGANASQHYMLHNGLFHNVTGTMTVQAVTLKGNVGATSLGSGALVCGIVKGSVSSTAKVVSGSSNHITLDGVYVHNISTGYAPLLINRSGSYSVLQIHNVSTTATYQNESRYRAATSLIGDAGNRDAASTNVKVEFLNIALDGRIEANAPALNVYPTTHSVFTQSTLLRSFMWTSGSSGTYNYAVTDDWNGTNHIGHVTYGSEISDNTTRNQYFGEEFWYHNQNHTDGSGIYTNYQNGTSHGAATAQSNPPVDFSGFLPYVYDASTKEDVKTTKKYQLEVNHAAAKLTGCGTYNDPYIVADGDFELIAKILQGTGDGTIRLPVISGYDGSTLLATKWHSGGQNGCEDYEWNTEANKFLNSAHQGYTKEVVGEYLAGAYYKVPDGGITLSKDFQGLGAITNASDTASVFRGVIVGNHSTITNKSNNPLILSSYGSVVKDVNIIVSAEEYPKTTISKANNNQFSVNTNEKFYGAVMGQIFGGDNIIDNVTVQFEEGKTIELQGGKKQLIPVGGYVGVVINGGLIFRGMEESGEGEPFRRGTEAIQGIPFDSEIVTDGTNTDLIAEDNTKWLYVNPIVGRVLNGYAITEATAYRPFEDGTRTYSNNDTVYWTDSGAVDSNPGENAISRVTMRNGRKHYSIADINQDETNTFQMDGIADNSNITVSSAQALHIMSLITQSGLGKSSTGHYSQTNKAVATNPESNNLTPYNTYMATHLADYSYVGNVGTISTEPSASISNPSTDEQKASNDYYLAKSQDRYDGAGTDKVPHIIEAYTNKLNDSIYPAFDVAGDTEHYFNLIFSGNNQIFYLPDGYRGLGALMFGVKKTDNTDNLDNFKENVIFLYSFNGNNKKVSLHMDLYVYGDDNYLPLTGNQAYFKTGFALINCLQSNYNSDSRRKLKNLTILGSVKYELINSSNGNHVNYNFSYVGNSRKSNPAVAAFVGVPVAGGGSVYFENITLDSMGLYGMRFAGGFVGALNVGAEYFFMGCSADDLKVFSGGAAGGIIGYMRNKNAKVTADFENKKYGIISIISAAEVDSLGDNSSAGAGGLIGDRTSSSSATNENITISNVTVSNGESVSVGYIGYYDDGLLTDSKSNPGIPAAGGIIGNAGQTTILTADHVTVKNLNICGAYAGGMAGIIQGPNSSFTIKNSEVLTDTAQKCRIESSYYNSTVDNGSIGNVLFSSGGFVGYNNAPSQATLTDSKLIGYNIIGYYNTGGVIGRYSSDASTTPKTKITNVELNGHHLKGDYNVGGLVGTLNGTGTREINGYNILIKNQSSEPYTGNFINNNGFIVGFNTKTSQMIKIAGFSRQGTINVEKMIGNKEINNAARYGGSGTQESPYGYVIFADYNDTGSTEHNEKFANVQTRGGNIGASGDHLRTTTTDLVYSANRNTDSTTIGSGDVTGAAVVSSQTPVIDDTGTFDASLGYDQEVSYSGTRIKNIIVEGGYLYYNSSSPQYFLNTIHYNSGNSVLMEKSDITEAAVWYFEPFGQFYKIYTIIDGVRNYIKTKTKTGNNIELTIDFNNADSIQKVAISNSNEFYLMNSDNTRWLQHSGSGGGIRYWTDNNNETNSKIYWEPANVSDSRYYAWEYDQINLDGTRITSTGDPSTMRLATPAEIADYVENNTNSDEMFELYYLTKTMRENVFADIDNPSPYVTTSPKTNITTGQWLTGDGTQKEVFIDNIDKDKADTTKPKRYQTAYAAIQSANYDTQKIINEFSSSFDEFGSDYGGEDFHMLILEDTETAVSNAQIVNYLRMLTNTDYDFSDDIYNMEEDDVHYTEANLPFRIVRKTFVYENGSFVKTNATPNLQYNNAQGFYMEATHIDSDAEKPQFTLLDVQFFDPTDTSTTGRKIAYHLYVPVYVRKIIQFRFSSHIASGTDYFPEPYDNTTLFENLGTPVTIQLNYAYHRTANEWIYAINNGESVMGNYYKSLNLKNETGTWKAGTKFALVDSSNNGKVYYLSSFTGGTTDLSIDFRNFSDEDNQFYEPLPLYRILNVVVEQVSSGAKLVQLKPGDDPATATVYYNGNYYKPLDVNYQFTDENNNTVSYTSEDVQYAVTGVSPGNETYYLSIFTPKADENEPIHHFSFTSPDKLADRTVEAIPKSKIRGSNQKLDLYTGNLYKNTFLSLDVISNSTDNPKMTETNNSLTVTMHARLELTDNAKAAHIAENLSSATNAKIFQTYLMTYSMTDENNVTKAGIQPGSSPDIGIISYQINGQDVDRNKRSVTSNLNHIEFANNTNMREYLIVDNGVALIDLIAKIEYDPEKLAIQFPPNTEGANNGVGTKVVAYSKIASSSETVANSSVLSKQEDGTLYFSDISSSASLTYTLDFEKSGVDPAGLYNDLGINAFEMTVDTAIINTEAQYDISMLNSGEEYVELKLRLSKRAAYGTWLPLGSYLKSVEIYGADGTTDLLSATNSDTIRVTKNTNEYIIRAKKDLLMTEGDKMFVFPIKLEVYTGNARFNSNRDANNQLIGLEYSNYMVRLTAEMFGSISGNDSLAPSHAEDYLIYTNARMDATMK